ncbi:hypothetical protein [Ferrimicrobium acidiphilum]|uniref:Uncharacterized protein n=1 Tax=Ferrimicrobium acidiphilum TaxID=121039 RepID=A0ABV3Y7H0_9ACTN|nr:hypothetical protein [Ferrimicrobium acidiphilum]MCL5053098.1 hypothetical protein [Gammaproteobacteria bacterium]
MNTTHRLADSLRAKDQVAIRKYWIAEALMCKTVRSADTAAGAKMAINLGH